MFEWPHCLEIPQESRETLRTIAREAWRTLASPRSYFCKSLLRAHNFGPSGAAASQAKALRSR
eukprot:6203655-Pleurochrysis_carterae.AAC.4